MTRIAIALLALAGCAAPQKPAASAEVTTVILVRHAEKGTAPKEDPPLTEAGIRRAEQLVEELKGQPLAAVFSTDFARTKATAAPVAAKLGLTTEVMDAKPKDHPQQVADKVLSSHRGQTVLVVGHSNTVTEIVAALGAPKPDAICDHEFDSLFIVRVPASGAATVERKKYGAASDDEGCHANMTR